MQDVLLALNQPFVLWSLFGGAVGLILLDYLLPVDWLAYLGYACFAVFLGATAPVAPAMSFAVMGGAFVVALIGHRFWFSKLLTNAPRIEQPREEESSPRSDSPGSDSPRSDSPRADETSD